MNAKRAAALFGMGLLLGLQGAVGWIMVASGLKPGMIAVEPVKLALHLTLASLFFVSVISFAVSLAPARREKLPAGLLWQGAALVVLVLVQIALGGLVAGSHSGLIYNTWPLMEGALIPPAKLLFPLSPWQENFVGNPALVQFDHRMIAYTVLALALWHLVSAYRSGSRSARKRAHAVAGLVFCQLVLGIVTLLLIVPIHAALAHQALAVLVLGMATAHAAAMRRDNA